MQKTKLHAVKTTVLVCYVVFFIQNFIRNQFKKKTHLKNMLKLSLECIVYSREASYSTCEEDTNTALQKVFGMAKSPDNERVCRYMHIIT